MVIAETIVPSKSVSPKDPVIFAGQSLPRESIVCFFSPTLTGDLTSPFSTPTKTDLSARPDFIQKTTPQIGIGGVDKGSSTHRVDSKADSASFHTFFQNPNTGPDDDSALGPDVKVIEVGSGEIGQDGEELQAVKGTEDGPGIGREDGDD